MFCYTRSLVFKSISSASRLLDGDRVLVVELGVRGGLIERSNSRSWPIKLKFGDTFDFLALTKSYASFKVKFCDDIR